MQFSDSHRPLSEEAQDNIPQLVFVRGYYYNDLFVLVELMEDYILIVDIGLLVASIVILPRANRHGPTPPGFIAARPHPYIGVRL